MITFREVLEFLKNPVIIGMLGIVFILICTLIGRRIYLKKQLRNQFDRLEVTYNELISVPLSFKINKANSLIKINDNLQDDVNAVKKSYEALTQMQQEIITAMGDAEDMLSFGKLGHAKSDMDALEQKLADGLKSTHDLDEHLNKILEQETEQRVQITALKDRFRKVKTHLMGNESVYSESYTILELHTHEIEQKFSTFEEWMFASNFEKAKALNVEITESLDSYETRIQEIPVLYELAKGVIPHRIDAVSSAFQQARGAGVYLSHLEVPKNIGLISESLKEDILNINMCEIESKHEDLEQLSTRLEQLTDQIDKEAKAHEEMNTSSVRVFEAIDALQETTRTLSEQKNVIAARFNISSFTQRMEDFETRIQEIDTKRHHIVRMIEEEKIPATSIVIAIRELQQDVTIYSNEFEVMHIEVSQANADEVRAKQQLMKLYLIINDVQVRIKRRGLADISDQYEHDVRHAKQYTRQIEDLLNQEILDVVRLNATVAEAIDFTYKLHNNVNNLVGVVDMCENAIVFANKYRAYVPDVDAELTRAELAFNNGEYTQSLKMIIQAIDRYKPNDSYEELIQNNAQSAK